MSMLRFAVRAAKFALATSVVIQGALPAWAQGANLPLIRDAEIESLMRIYTKPIFKVAGVTEGAAKVYLVNQPNINAFVAGGQRIFINTGLLTQTRTPNEVIGVLAHETGHIAGGHLARMGAEVDKASTQAIIGMLIGAAAIAGGVASGSSQASQAGAGVFMGTQGLVTRSLLAYVRAQESSADQAAIKFLDATGQSGRGMLTLFQKLANQSMGSLKNVNPYVMTHPMPLDRIRNLEVSVKKSPFYDRQDPADLVLRHRLMQAKLAGFLSSTQQVFQQYPVSDKSLPARYARSIAAYRIGDLKNALREINALIDAQPGYAYFWELKGQALLESGRAREAVAPLQKAAKLSNGNGLIQIMLAQALLQEEGPANAQLALKILRASMRTERESPGLHAQMAIAYARLGNIPLADLATAEAAILRGDRELASQKAQLAAQRLKQGSPEWLRAKDILNFTDRKKS
ncbi:MAG TPA: M48 family metalloprotease [Aestuariivirgaceae bacterium]